MAMTVCQDHTIAQSPRVSGSFATASLSVSQSRTSAFGAVATFSLRQQIDARSNHRPNDCDQIEDEHPKEVSPSARTPHLARIRLCRSFRSFVESSVDDVAGVSQARIDGHPCVRSGLGIRSPS